MGDGGNDPVSGQTAAVELTAITKRFGSVVAVDNVDLEIADGEFFALLGPSGCGKTTTLRMVAGLEFPTEGSLKIFGNEAGTLPPNKRPVNTVFQDYALFPHMTVEANVAFGLKMQRVAKGEIADRVQEAISLVRLEGLEQRRSQQLSGGQRQRVALARALVNRPKVLLLDEPLGALDLKLRQEMQGELKALQREVGITFVFVTHDQEEALTMADRIGVMNEGDLLQVGTPAEIYEHPVNRFVANFIGQTNLLDASVVSNDTVCLANGVHIPGKSDLPVGTRVAVCLRPERAGMYPPEEVPADQQSVVGRLESVTYLGNALVYTVVLDWARLEVRRENQPGGYRPHVGQEVAVSWTLDAISVVRA
ncbi:MAG: ABC transporter ATP-binding protein [Acidimicrobiia bacterium]|nr:ABC transporter ATP-binding protein [Acidimicrobiia bacterium]MYG57523.1 ABC transporter ATP-binding protein [Acidimicrobiia bacterium]MYJ34283.1 ABC transporter ATP-binding protein [Acidimicrobiia bacterium]